MADPIELHLNDRLVIRQFGHHLRGGMLTRRLRLYTMRSTAGVRWKRKGILTKNGGFIPIGEPELVRNELTTDAMIALSPIKGRRGWWRVYTDPKWHNQAMQWLCENCGAETPPDINIDYMAVEQPKKRRKHKYEKLANWGRMPQRVDNG